MHRKIIGKPCNRENFAYKTKPQFNNWGFVVRAERFFVSRKRPVLRFHRINWRLNNRNKQACFCCTRLRFI